MRVFGILHVPRACAACMWSCCLWPVWSQLKIGGTICTAVHCSHMTRRARTSNTLSTVPASVRTLLPPQTLILKLPRFVQAYRSQIALRKRPHSELFDAKLARSPRSARWVSSHVSAAATL